ncbi:MAG: hypothetical protein DSM106950_01475 [Stigonema ocellatum SAG 48.90 = DSM 106950]|nr:hypothetical protein [Stigonema ocellatum SAG 48.90 = DSM 106950]
MGTCRTSILLAANLARIKSFLDDPAHGDLVVSLVKESKFFIEWTAPSMDIDQAAELVDLQRLLSRWQRHWSQICTDTEARNQVTLVAKQASERVLSMSGLLSQSAAQ